MDGHQPQHSAFNASGDSSASAMAARRALIRGLVAACVLCLGWLIPFAYAEGDHDGGAGVGTVSPADSKQ